MTQKSAIGTTLTRAAILMDQTAQSIQQALIPLIIDIIPDSGTVIRTDGATSFQSLCTEAEKNGSILNKFKIKIEIGRLLNKNKNPTAENAIHEIQ